MAGISKKNDYKFNLNGIEVEVIDNDDDGTAEYVLYLVETLSEVRSYSARNEEVSFYTPDNGSVTEEMADVVTELDLATGDLILYVQYGGRTYITEHEVVTGTMTRVDRDKDDELYITVNDETYYQSYIPDVASGVDADLTHFDITIANKEPGFDDEYDFILDSNGYVVAIRPAEEIVTNYALVLDSAWTLNGLRRGGTIEVLMADGTKGTYDINWDKSVKNVFGKDNDDEMEDYLGTRDVVGGEGTGAAVGTVITYSLSDDEVLTIESVLKTHENLDTDGYVQKDQVDNGDIAYIENNAAAKDNGVVRTTPNLQWTLQKDYKNGNASIVLNDGNGNTDVTYAIDRNTVAFYYYVDPKTDEISYGVATGWNNMGDVLADNPDKTGANDVGVQVYPVMNKDRDNDGWTPSKLADVVLINAANNPTSSDYMLVLNRNARVADDTLLLNVVFEDGTTEEIEIDDNNSDIDFEDPDDFMAAYPYVKNTDGTYDITDEPIYTSKVSELLEVGTVDANGTYYALPDDAKVWDVNDVDSATEDPQPGEFYFIEVNAVIIPTTQPDGRTIRTAWIWDYDADGDNGNFDTSDYQVNLDDAKDEITINFNHEVGEPSEDRALALIEAKLKEDGYTIADRERNGNLYTWTVEDKYGFKAGTFDFRYEGNKTSYPSGDWMVECYVGRLNGEEKFVPIDSTGISDFVSKLTGTHFYGRLKENDQRTYLLKSDASNIANGFDIEDGYTEVDLSRLAITGTGTDDLKITEVTVDGDKVDFGSSADQYYVKVTGSEKVVVTVAGSVKVANGSGYGYIVGTGSVAKVVKEGDCDDNSGSVPAVGVTNTSRINFAQGASARIYSDFTLTFTWTVTSGTAVTPTLTFNNFNA